MKTGGRDRVGRGWAEGMMLTIDYKGTSMEIKNTRAVGTSDLSAPAEQTLDCRLCTIFFRLPLNREQIESDVCMMHEM